MLLACTQTAALHAEMDANSCNGSQYLQKLGHHLSAGKMATPPLPRHLLTLIQSDTLSISSASAGARQ